MSFTAEVKRLQKKTLLRGVTNRYYNATGYYNIKEDFAWLKKPF